MKLFCKSANLLPVLAIATCCVLATPAASFAKEKSAKSAAATGGATAKDKQYIKNVAESNVVEMAMAKLALSKSNNADVKQFAQMMMDDHSGAESKLAPIAQKDGVSLPPPMLAKHKATAARLEKLSGDAFDKVYVAANVKGHQETATKMETGMGGITDPDLKTYAEQTLPVVKGHLQKIQDIQSKLGGSAAASKAGKKS